MDTTPEHELTGAGDEGPPLDPEAAAELLERTTERARRGLEFPSPLLLLIVAVTTLAAYGAAWLSVRDQHPYTGPSLAALAELYGFIAVGAIAVGWELHRTRSGVVGRSIQHAQVRSVGFGAALISLYVLMGALRFDGFSYAIVYGIMPAAGPLIVGGAAAAGYASAREDKRMLGFAVALLALGAGGAFAGPTGVWAVVGVGIFAVLVGTAVLQARLRGRWTLASMFNPPFRA
jgi:hypothetical protein